MATAQAEQPRPRASESAKHALLKWGRRVLMLIVIAGASYQLARNWAEVSDTLLQLPWESVVLSFSAVFVGIWLGPMVWRVMVTDLGSPLTVKDASKIYLVGQLGKYIPGSVWAFLVQMELGKAAGVSRPRSFTASLLTAGIGVVASLIVGILAVPAFASGNPGLLWLFALLPIGLGFLHPRPLSWLVSRVLRLLRKPPLAHPLTGAAIARATGMGVALYLAEGLHMWLLVNSLGSPGLSGFLICVGTIGLAMTASLVVFFLPSGLGARELVIVTGILSLLPYGQALALALVSRLMFTIADLASAGGAALLAYHGRRKSAVATGDGEIAGGRPAG